MLDSKVVFHKLNTLFQLFQDQELTQIHRLEVLCQNNKKQELMIQPMVELEVWFTFHLLIHSNQNLNYLNSKLIHLWLINKKPIIKKSTKLSKLDSTPPKTL
jgi:hypothetical protein